MVIKKYKRIKYKVSFKDACNLTIIELEVKWKKIKRFLFVLIKSNSLLLWLLPLWAIFVLITFLIGSNSSKELTIGNLLWDYRTAFFTSVIIVGFNASIAGIEKHKKIVKVQYRYYNSLCNAIEELAKYMFFKIGKKGPFCILKTEERFSKFNLQIIDSKDMYDVQEFDIYINAIRAILLNIKSDKYFDDFIYKGNLYAKKEIDFIYYINRFLERDNYYFINNLNYLYDFIDSFGYIWRFEERIMAKGDRLMKKRNKTFKYIDDEFLCEIYFADSIEKNPYQPIIDSN